MPTTCLDHYHLRWFRSTGPYCQLSTELLNRILLKHERDGELGKYPSTPPGSGLVNQDFTVSLIQVLLNLKGIKYNLN